ncbi:ABC transporter substrate-binding protein [Allobranchiibius sp. CTAmp26]|uniref:ABC transporter substrate-binding protein n=1 Tax=Allobranchiibius sp. CTAmp26 TaxID=2815214 RepID=UPI001AA147B1|nr:ABC transporter substrate-binding protein [Allobranchiibius sp. CTAmp26]MBO1755828.1 ABC transporter substrate-binding protein [Allobranchiibius sp. CTAmp26]
MTQLRHATTTKVAALGSIAALGCLALTGCGSNSLGGSSSTTASGSGSSSTAPAGSSTATLNSTLAAKVPAAIKAKGTLTIGSDASYAPNEFLGSDGKTVQGMDVDLFNAVATTLGLKTNFQNASFDTIILGVNSGKYDVGVSSFTINADREKQVAMVSYFSAGTQWAVKKGNPKKVDIGNACGLTVGVQKGTVEIDDLTARSKKCTSSGKKPITQIVEEQQSKVTADLISGKVDAMSADSPITLYAIKQTGDQLQTAGALYGTAPYGIVVPKKETALATAFSEALQALDKSGVYKNILAKWGNTSGAVTSFAVNPSVS